MPDLYAADDTGTYRKASGLWVADNTGTYRKALSVSGADAAGTFRGGSIGGGVVNSFTVKPGWTPHLNTTVYFNVSAVTKTEVWVAGEAAPRASSTTVGSTVEIGLGPDTPGRLLSIFLRLHAAGGGYADSAAVAHRVSTLPAPANFRLDSTTYDRSYFRFDPVSGATAYRIVHSPGGQLIVEAPASTAQPWMVFNSSRTKYTYAVRTLWNSVVSGLSNPVSFTTPAPPGPAHGDYSYKPTSAATWQAGTSSFSARWRPSADGLYHGNGSAFGSNRGNQTGVLFYGTPWSSLRGGRVTRARVYLYRSDDAGNSAAQPCRWHLHKHTGQPGGAPALAGGTTIGSLARGQGAEFELPASWGQYLVDGVYSGIAWGDVNPYYMRAPHPSQLGSGLQGRIIITIG